jgi:hypothetical protein
MSESDKISIGLTQFIDFTVKGSPAKTNMVRKIKYQNEYHPAFDYWKSLRDGIIKFHEQNLDFNFFEQLINSVETKKKANYISAIQQYKKFLKNKDISWFNPGKSIWTSNELVVRSTPELGLIINGKPHLIKLYFKGKSENVNKSKIGTTVTLLNTSIFDLKHDSQIEKSVLNLQKGNLYSDKTINTDKLIALESEAAQFVYIWNKI